jgi:hypothetical protein
MSINCDDVMNQYDPDNDATVVANGVMNGLSGVLGLSGFWNPTESFDDMLSNIQTNQGILQEKLSNILKAKENRLTDYQQKFFKEQKLKTDVIKQINDEIIKEKIQENQLYITITFMGLLIVIIYLVIS